MIEWAESESNAGRYKPSSPENMVTAVLKKTKERIDDVIACYRDDKPRGRALIVHPLPSFPKD
jgi:hypothetical protein